MFALHIATVVSTPCSTYLAVPLLPLAIASLNDELCGENIG